MLRSHTIHRLPSTVHRGNGIFPRPPMSVHVLDGQSTRWIVFPLEFYPPGGLFTQYVNTPRWTVENPIHLGGQWTVGGGFNVNTLGKKFKFVEVTLFLYFITYNFLLFILHFHTKIILHFYTFYTKGLLTRAGKSPGG